MLAACACLRLNDKKQERKTSATDCFMVVAGDSWQREFMTE